MKIIAGVQVASDGSVNAPKEYRIGYLPQEMEHDDTLSVIDVAMQAFEEVNQLEAELAKLTQEISERTDYESESYVDLIQALSDANERLDALGANSTEEQAHRILQGLGFKIDDMGRAMGEFSGGWKMRVELAKLLLMQPDLLLLDEPTNHLDIESIEWLEAFLMHHPGAILLISHDRVFLDTLTKRTVEIGGVKVYDYKGPYSAYQLWREEERERQSQAAKNQQKYIQDTEQLINKFRAKKNKAAFAQSLIKKLDKLERVEVDAAENAQIRFFASPAPRSGKVIFEAQGVKKCFDELTVFEGLDFIMARQEKVALVGKNGAEKTTFTRMLLNLERQPKAPWRPDTTSTLATTPKTKPTNSTGTSPSSKHSRKWPWATSESNSEVCWDRFCSQGKTWTRRSRCCQEGKRHVWPCASSCSTPTTC